MIILTTPAQINSVLGGNVPVGFDKLVVGPFTMDPKTLLVSSHLQLTSTGSPTMAAIQGRLTIKTVSALLEIEVPQLDFYRRVSLTGPQNTAVQNQVRAAQDALESGLITLGVIAGTQSTGA